MLGWDATCCTRSSGLRRWGSPGGRVPLSPGSIGGSVHLRRMAPRCRRGSVSHGREGRPEMGRVWAMLRRAGLAVVFGVLLSGVLTPAAAQMALYEDWAAE